MTILWQAAKQWRSEVVGEGPGRVGKIGCVITTFANFLRFWGIDPAATPVTVMEKARAFAEAETKRTGKKVRAFIGDNVVWDVVGAANGLVVEDVVDERNSQVLMREAIVNALTGDKPAGAFVWVDKDSPTTPDSDERGKHWVGAVAIIRGDKDVDDAAVYLDSATADDGTLNLRTLAGVTSWNGETKLYRGRAVRVVRPA